MASILIKNVILKGKEQDVLIEGNKIKEIGKVNEEAEFKIDGKNKAILPGLINLHTHGPMTLLRGFADDMTLHEWLNKKIWPVEAKLTYDDITWGTKFACLEMIKTGTTCFNDQYFHARTSAKAVEDLGMRAFLSGVFLDHFDGVDQKEYSKKLMKDLRDEFGELITPCLGPHAIYTVGKDNLQWIKKLADKEKLLIHMHLSESEKEVEDCVKEHGKRPVHYLEDIGFLGENVIFAHGVWFTDDEIKTLAKYKVKIAHCPVSNMKLSVGNAIRYEALLNAGINMGLGTDGTASNNTLDMFEEMKIAALLQKMMTNRQTVLNAHQAFDMATIGGAKALGLNAGRVEEGKLADVILVNLKDIQLCPGHNLISDVVYAANGTCVDTTIVNGKILMHNRKVEGEEEIIEKARECALDLVKR